MPDQPSSSSASADSAGPAASPGRPARRVWPWLLTAVFLALMLALLTNPVVEQWAHGRILSGLFAGRVAPADPPDTGPETGPGTGPDTAQVMTASAVSPQALADLEARVAQLEQKQQADESALAMAPASAPAAAPTSALERRVASLEAQAGNLVAADVGLTARVEAMVQDVQQVRGNTQASDKQVRELFLLSLTRRLVATGRTISPLNDLLDRAYGQQYPGAVQALTALAASPRGRTNLADRLADLPLAAAVGAPQTWWQRFWARLTGLISVSPGASGMDHPEAGSPADRQLAARVALTNGDLDAAIRAVDRLPPSSTRDNWVKDARALLHAEQALDMLEESAMGRMIDLAAGPDTEQPPVNAPDLLSAAPAG